LSVSDGLKSWFELARLGERDRLAIESISLSKLAGNKRPLFRGLILALLIGTAYVLLFALREQHTLSIVVKPCGNESAKA
jgi:hypothetical protein